MSLLVLLLASAGAWAAIPDAAPAVSTSPAAMLVEDAVAVVNGRAVMLSEYQKNADATVAYLRRTAPAALEDPAIMRKVRENTLEELITRELLVQTGQKAGMTVDDHDIDDAVEEIKGRFKDGDGSGPPLDDAAAEEAFRAKLASDGVDYAQYRQSLTSDIMARKVIARYVTSKVLPTTDEEVRAYFARIQAYLASKSTSAPSGMDPEDAGELREAAYEIKMLSSEGVRVSRILIRVSSPATDGELKRALKAAQALKARLDAGEDFEKLAREASEDPESAARGGDIGYVVRGNPSPELEKAAFSLAVGRTSEPILTAAGYDLIRVTEKRSAKAPVYDVFKKDLESYLDGLSQTKKLRGYLKELRSHAAVERHLPSTP